MAFLGIDLHTNNFTIATLNITEGSMDTKVTRFALQKESMDEFVKTLKKDDYILIESSSNSFWFYDQVRPFVKNCFVYNVNYARNSGNKTDKIDAKLLAEKLAFYILFGKDESKLPTVYVPDKRVRELRSLLSTYKFLGKMITQCKNRMHSIFVQNGIYIEKKSFDRKNFESRVLSLEISEIWMFQVKCLLNQLKSTKAEQQNVKDMIYLLGNELFENEIKYLISIDGFSPFTSIVLMTDVVDVKRFKTHKKYCAYLRTAPRIKESNSNTKLKNANKQSRSLTCTILTQSANHFKVAGSYFTSFYNRVKTGKCAGKVRIALIRKILVCTYYMLKNEKYFYWYDESKLFKKQNKFNKELIRIENKFKNEGILVKAA